MRKSVLFLALGLLGLAACSGSEPVESAAPTPTTKAATAEDLNAAAAHSARPKPGAAEDLSAAAAAPAAGPQASTTGDLTLATSARSERTQDAPVEEVSGSIATADGMAYDLGRTLGEQTGRSAWKSVSPDGSCDGVDKLAEVIGRSSERIVERAGRSGKEEMLDYAEGYVHGLRAALAEVAVSCSSRCSVLCKAASSAGSVILCQVQKTLGGDLVLRRAKDAPVIPCPEAPGDCDKSPSSVKAGDCP